MKKLLLSLSIVFSIAMQAQQVTTFLNTEGPYGGIVLDPEDNMVYIASEFDGVIYKKEALSTNNEYTTLNSGGEGSMQTGLCKMGNYLYVNRWHDNAIVRVNMADNTYETIATVPHPGGIAGLDNKLYVYSEDKIHEVNLATTPATVSVAIDELDLPTFESNVGLKIYDGYLYIGEVNKISRVNLSVTPFVKEDFLTLPFYPIGFTRAQGGSFYATGDDYNSVYSIENGVVDVILSTNNFGTLYPTPNDIVYSPEDHTLIVSCMEGYNVLKTQVPFVGTESFKKPVVSIYPNPASNFISINGMAAFENATVTNTLGQTVARYQGAEKYDVSPLPAGVYYLNVTGQSLKFIKQ